MGLCTKINPSTKNKVKMIDILLDVYPPIVAVAGGVGGSIGFFCGYQNSRNLHLNDCVGHTLCNTIVAACGGMLIGILSPLIVPIVAVTILIRSVDNGRVN
jgi:hypothetical protein